MDRRRKKPKKPQTKKKQGGIEAPAQAAIEQRLMEEEERLVQLTMELSLKESLLAESTKVEEPEVQEESFFESQLRSALLAFDPDLESYLDPFEEDKPSNNAAVSLFHQYCKHLMPGAREKTVKEKMQVALLLAAVLGLPRVVKYLMDRGASPEIRMLNGWTPMHFAAALGNVSVIREMLRVVPNLNLLHEYKDKAEMTPLDILAQELEQTPVKIPLELLKLFGRWRSHTQASDATVMSYSNGQAMGSNVFGSFNDGEDIDEETMESLRSSADSGFREEYSGDDDEEEDMLNYHRDAMNQPGSQLFAWGTGALHLQGHGDMTSRQNPKRVRSLESSACISIATSQFMSAAAFRDGSAYVWGLSEGMRLGIPTPNAQEILQPLRIPPSLFGHQAVTQVSLSNYHGAFVTADGMLFTFGRGREGQLGLGNSLCDPSTLNDPQLPAPLSYLSTKSSSSALSDSGKRSTSTTASSPDPKNPYGAAATPQQATTEFHAAVLNPAGGDAFAHGLARVKLSSKMKLDPAFYVTQVACSDSHTAILTQSGHCWTFGNGSKGQLGHDVLRGEHSPRLVRGLGEIRFRHVSAGPTHTVVASQSDVWVFGFGNAAPRRQKFAFGTPAIAVKMGLLPSFNICALASGTLHYLILTKEGDLFSWMHGIDVYPVAVNVDTKQLEKTRSQFESSMAHSGFSVHSGSSNSGPISLSGHSFTDDRSGLDRERHHAVGISCVGTMNYVTTSDGLVFTFANSQRRSAPFTRLNIQPRIRLLAPGRTHFLSTIDQPIPPRESYRPPNPPKLLSRDLHAVYRNQLFADVVIGCGEEVRKGHRFILSISPYLNTIFESLEGQMDPAFIKLPESVPIVALDLLLSFIYFGHFVVPEHYAFLDLKKPLGLKTEHKQSLVDLATQWGLDMLVDLIVEAPKSATAPFTSFPSSFGGASEPRMGTEEHDELSMASYRPWIRLMEEHLKALTENPRYSDAILVVGEEQSQTDQGQSSPPSSKANKLSKAEHTEEIPVHRALVVERSEWLRMTLSMSSGWVESQTQKVSMPHLRNSSARLVVSYLYTDSLPNKDNTSLERLRALADLVATADELLLPELKLIVARRLSRMLTPENVAAILDVAETYSAEDLQNCILHWISSNVELLLRLGSLSDLTNQQMMLVEEVTLADRGVQPWRYFRQDTEDKILKMASGLMIPVGSEKGLFPESQGAVGANADPQNSPVPSSVSDATDTDSTASNNASVAPKAVYIPPSKRRAMAEAEKALAEKQTVYGSPTTPVSFLDIQKEQIVAEQREADSQQSQKPKISFNWASPSKVAAPLPSTGRTNHVLTSTSQSLWPSLPGAQKPAEASSAPVAAEVPDSAVPTVPAASAPSPSAPAAAAPPKKQKILPSPLRDPKTLTSKDAIFTPKTAVTAPAPAAAAAVPKKTAASASSSTQPQATKPVPSSAQAQSSKSTPKPANAKMSAAAAEYKPSAYAPEQGQSTSTAPAAPKKKNTRQTSEGPGAHKGHQQSQQPKQRQNRQHSNDLAGAMKPTSTKPPRSAAAQNQPLSPVSSLTGLTPDEELALALSRSMEETGIVAIQKEELALQQHRHKSILEIQEEERQLEEHRMVEAYYASRQGDQQRKPQQSSPTDSPTSAPRKGSNSTKRH
jgi:alpha-tubulin suppressor-like RCC1 family protein